MSPSTEPEPQAQQQPPQQQPQPPQQQQQQQQQRQQQQECQQQEQQQQGQAQRAAGAAGGATAEQPAEQAPCEPSARGRSIAEDGAEDGAAAGGASSSGRPECYVIVYNMSKHSNVGTLLRSCTAFGVKEACLVGSRQFNTFGSHGAAEYVALRHFATIEACCEHLRNEAGCRILGVEIDERAVPVQSHPFHGNTAFMLGNEGQGLSEKQLRQCDGFVYIPQHGPGTASLNVTVAASIVLHQFASWARYPERAREGAKFCVAPKPQRTRPRGIAPSEQERSATRADARRDPAAAADAAAREEWLADAVAAAGGADALWEAVAADGTEA